MTHVGNPKPWDFPNTLQVQPEIVLVELCKDRVTGLVDRDAVRPPQTLNTFRPIFCAGHRSPRSAEQLLCRQPESSRRSFSQTRLYKLVHI